MRLRFLGSTSEAGACPTLYETDHGTVVEQGLELVDPDARADLRHDRRRGAERAPGRHRQKGPRLIQAALITIVTPPMA